RGRRAWSSDAGRPAKQPHRRTTLGSVIAGNAWTLVKRTVASWLDDYAPSMGAALAYYTVFSVAPLLLIVIAVAGLVFGQEASEGEVFEQLRLLMGPEAARAVQEMLRSAYQPARGTLATIGGIAVLLVGATTVF